MEFSGVKITAGAVATLLSGVLLFVLYSHAREGDTTAIVILAVAATLTLVLLGVAIAIGTVPVAELSNHTASVAAAPGFLAHTRFIRRVVRFRLRNETE